ncbi:hypothetical protein F5X68DRAFT_262513 [Plectosphaerella plurivora]|uniref:Uncharacterized protein n=1 Tax=Plectosphaerella plurivora TaxID=936078 RepID=A0A9P8V9B3_9PEZI|nr:hypothetical protein F5X68DRAFT_262513 [Plectosphaerella plurivora]
MTMDVLKNRQSDDEDCPRGAKFYNCSDNLFTGCCSVDPCNLTTCPDHGDPDEGGDEKETKTTASPTTRLEMTISSSVNIPIVTSFSTEVSEAVTTELPTSDTITSTLIIVSESISVVITTGTDATSTLSEILAIPDPTTTTDGPGGLNTLFPTDAAGGDIQEGNNGLTTQQIIGIAAGLGSIALIGGFIWFWLNRRRCKVNNAIGFGDRSFSGYELRPYALSSAQRIDDPFGHAAEGQFTRASAYKRPLSRQGVRDGSVRGQFGGPLSSNGISAPPRAMTAAAGPAVYDPQPGMSSPDESQVEATRLTWARGEATHLDWTRGEVSTPEIVYSPGLAQVATFRGLPRIVEIPSTRRDFHRTYVPYRPGATSGSRVASAPRIRANLVATDEERSRQQHVTSWAQYEETGRRD